MKVAGALSLLTSWDEEKSAAGGAIWQLKIDVGGGCCIGREVGVVWPFDYLNSKQAKSRAATTFGC